MVFHVSFVFLLFVVVCFGAERNSVCKTPNGEEARCVPIFSCGVLIKSIMTKNTDNINFSKKSQCGFDTNPLVCCGSFGHFLPVVTIFNRFADDYEDEELDQIQTPYSEFLDSLLPRNKICVANINNTRVNGTNKFPWVVALKNSSHINCSGVIISSHLVLTTSDCVNPQNNNTHTQGMKVLAGRWFSTNFTCPTKKCVERNVTSVITTKIPGMALIKLQSEVTFNDDIKPICLSTSTKMDKSRIRSNGTTSDYLFSTNNKNEWHFEGIFQKKPSVFINISDHYDWIVKNVLQNM